MKLLSIGKFAEMVGVTPSTLRNMHQSGDFIPQYISKGGTRYYSIKQLQEFTSSETKKITIGYCRVSSHKKNLQEQVDNLKLYMTAKGYTFEIITDVGSGVNYQNKGLKALIEKINNQEVSTIVVMSKDRLVSFGYELLEYFCEINGVTIEVVNNTNQDDKKEIEKEFYSIVLKFASSLFGLRSRKTKNILDALKS